MSPTPSLQLAADRLLPADPSVRAVARRLYEQVPDLPIISPHGHVPAQWLADDIAFADPTSLLITPDHYVTRLLHAHGVDLGDLGVGRELLRQRGVPAGLPDPVRALERLPRHPGPVLAGRPARRHLRHHGPADGAPPPTPSTTRSPIGSPARSSGPRACSSASASRCWPPPTTRATTSPRTARLADDPSWTARVVPTFRPDRYLEPRCPTWNADVDRLAETSGIETGDYDGWLAAMAARRAHFIAHGAVSADHSHPTPGPTRSSVRQAGHLYALARKGEITPTEAVALRRHLLFQMAPMSAEDGLVMTLHPASGATTTPPAPGVRRRHRRGHPGGGRVHRRPAAAAGRGGHAPELPAGAVHRRRDDVLPRDRAAGRLLPERVRRRAVVVPGRPRGDPALPRRRHRDGRASPRRPASSTTPAPSAPSPPGTTCPADSTPPSSPGWSPSTGSTRTRRYEVVHDLVDTNPRRAFKL